MSKVALDANVLVGHLDQYDSLHVRAEELGERIRANGDVPQVIDLLLQEAILVDVNRATANLSSLTARKSESPTRRMCSRNGSDASVPAPLLYFRRFFEVDFHVGAIRGAGVGPYKELRS